MSDPKIGSEDFPNLIRSDDQCNQSEVATSANEMGSDVEKQILHLKTRLTTTSVTDYIYSMQNYTSHGVTQGELVPPTCPPLLFSLQ